ncbi:MAG TPA: hypothetical protein VG603_09000 [Chitinophagales bacterium]|nr:hypothetical protein [Chitinophagales bacterium]
MKTHNLIYLLLFTVAAGLIGIASCKKDTTPPHNPYDDINRNDSTVMGIPVDSLTITYVHEKVLSTRCALNGCHDGHFEPDYRTPQSSFSTLVYAPIVKNNTQNQYKYRVIPYDTANSVMYIRITNCCFVNTNDRMPQDNIGVELPDSSLNLVAQWILHGARDMFGHVATMPNEPPVVQGYVAASLDLQTFYSNTRVDSVYYNPFIVPTSVSSFYVGVIVNDDNTPVNQLQYNRLKISTNETDFSNATSVTASFFQSGGNQIWLATINTASLPVGDTLFMRYYVNDGSHATNTEYPNNNLPEPYFTYWSFIRQ